MSFAQRAKLKKRAQPEDTATAGKTKAAPPWEDEGRSQKLERFREGLRIDRNALDECCERHAQTYLDVIEAHVMACSRRDENKTAMDEVYALQCDEVRKELEKGKERHTEAMVKEAVMVSKQYLDAIARYQDAKKESDLLGAMVQAYDQRGKMLRELAQLYVAGYFADVTVRGAQGGAREQGANVAQATLASARKGYKLPSRG